MALMSALDFSFMLENPGSSCILLHPRLAWFLRKLQGIGMPVPRLVDIVFQAMLSLKVSL